MITKSHNKELRDLGLRIYNNKMITEEKNGVIVNKDEKEILDIIDRTFGNGGTPSPENLHLFNQLLVETADVIAEPKVEYILGLLADFKSVPSGAVQIYTVPKTAKPKWVYTAKGTGVDLTRLSGSETKVIATPKSVTYGAYYEITTFRADPMRAFNEAVDNLVEAKLDFYFKKIFELMATSISNGKIPANNVASGASLGLTDFQKVENTMIRLGGGRPIFVGDIALVNHFALDQVSAGNALVTDELRNSLRDDLIPTQISKSIALTFPNEWIDESNSKVKFDVSQGFMFPANGKKAFAITEFGTQRQYSELDPETEQVKLKVVFEFDVTLLNGRYLGSINDDSVTV